MIHRRREGESYRQGLSWMYMGLTDRWYFGLFLRIGRRIMGFRYRSHSFAVLTWVVTPK